MKSKTKQYQKEISRKPKLSQEFRKSFLFVGCIVFLLDFIISIVVSNSYINSDVTDVVVGKVFEKLDDNGLDMNKVERIDGILHFKGSDEEEQINGDDAIASLQYFCATDMVTSSSYLFIDSLKAVLDYYVRGNEYEINPKNYIAYYNSNGEQLGNGDGGTFLFMKQEEEAVTSGSKLPARCFRFNEAAVEAAYPGLYNEIKEECYDFKIKDEVDNIIGFEGVKVKGSTFLADQIVIKDFTTSVILKSWNIDKVDMTGYETFGDASMNVKVLGPVVIDCEKDSPSYKAFHNHYKELIEEEFRDRKTDSTIRNTKYRNHESLFCEKGYDIIQVGGTSNVYKVVVKDVDFFRDLAPFVFSFYFLTLIIALVISFICAKLRYGRKLVIYDTDSFRRNTTNAMAHDLKSPLMVISGYAENIASGNTPDKTEHYATLILDTAKYMDQMITNILDLSKLEDGKVALDKREVSLHKLVAGQCDLLEKQIENKTLDIKIEGEKTIVADVFWMERLVSNLISNALKYSKKETELQVILSDRSLVVKNEFDNELNAEPEKLKEAFVKGDNARSNEDGNGLGLSIVDRIAKAHGFVMNISVVEKSFIVEIIFGEKK